ncbi:uncharacterized protein LOC141725205 [Zonotrichia albicollis]|uniref:uncharacterized protein LOC141725205 n=1 Tax=Zonotrichia albicollis TaxID=44394 RepID=UPI003D80D59D
MCEGKQHSHTKVNGEGGGGCGPGTGAKIPLQAVETMVKQVVPLQSMGDVEIQPQPMGEVSTLEHMPVLQARGCLEEAVIQWRTQWKERVPASRLEQPVLGGLHPMERETHVTAVLEGLRSLEGCTLQQVQKAAAHATLRSLWLLIWGTAPIEDEVHVSPSEEKLIALWQKWDEEDGILLLETDFCLPACRAPRPPPGPAPQSPPWAVPPAASPASPPASESPETPLPAPAPPVLLGDTLGDNSDSAPPPLAVLPPQPSPRAPREPPQPAPRVRALPRTASPVAVSPAASPPASSETPCPAAEPLLLGNEDVAAASGSAGEAFSPASAPPPAPSPPPPPPPAAPAVLPPSGTLSSVSASEAALEPAACSSSDHPGPVAFAAAAAAAALPFHGGGIAR